MKLLPTQRNPLLATDVYKLGHLQQYSPGITKVYSYLMARSNKVMDKSVFFGLQYYLKQYLSQKLTPEMGQELLDVRKKILGSDSEDVTNKVMALCNLGYFPVEVKAIPEGTVMPVRNVLMTIENTHPDFYWCVGFIESLLLKVWASTTVASRSYQYKQTIRDYFGKTVSDDQIPLLNFMVHDFGYRGAASEEDAAISGAAHLINFTGSDTVPALPFVQEFYGAQSSELIMASVPASEHSIMCSYGRDNEIGAFRHMLELYPTGIVSIVSDTYSVYEVLTNFVDILYTDILSRDGKVVFRPDSGDPLKVICGNPDAKEGTPEHKGCIRLLDEKFGSSINNKGFKVLNPKVGLIYGDGMYLERYQNILNCLMAMGYAASNLIIGIGGILRYNSRDTLGFALKATYVEVNGEPMEIEKDPITDPGKKSHKGLVGLFKENDQYVTKDQLSQEQMKDSLLQLVFRDGSLFNETSLKEIRERANDH